MRFIVCDDTNGDNGGQVSKSNPIEFSDVDLKEIAQMLQEVRKGDYHGVMLEVDKKTGELHYQYLEYREEYWWTKDDDAYWESLRDDGDDDDDEDMYITNVRPGPNYPG